MRWTRFLLVIALAIACWTRAATHHVSADFPTIQEATDAAATGDIVMVAPGQYPETLQFRGRDITLTSTAPLGPRGRGGHDFVSTRGGWTPCR